MSRQRVVFASVMCFVLMIAAGASANELRALRRLKDTSNPILTAGHSQIGQIRGMDAPFNVVGPSACAEIEPNETLALADPIGLPETCTGNVGEFDAFDIVITYSSGLQDGIEDVYVLNLTTTTKVDVTLTATSASADLDVFMFNAALTTIYGQGNGSANPEHFLTAATLTPGLYYIGVSAFDGSSAYSLAVAGSGGPPGTPPIAPSNLVATATSSSVIRLTWNDNSSDETEFRVEQMNSGGTFVDIGASSANTTAINVTGFDPGDTGTFRMRARNASGDSAYTNQASATTPGGSGACTANSTTVCLLTNRFRVQIGYRNQFSNPPGQTGDFVVQRLNPSAVNPDTAIFGFGSPLDVEVVVRLVDARPFAPRFDLYYGGLTDVEYTVTVTDTQTGTTRQYHNNPGTVGGGVDRASFPTN